VSGSPAPKSHPFLAFYSPIVADLPSKPLPVNTVPTYTCFVFPSSDSTRPVSHGQRFNHFECLHPRHSLNLFSRDWCLVWKRRTFFSPFRPQRCFRARFSWLQDSTFSFELTSARRVFTADWFNAPRLILDDSLGPAFLPTVRWRPRAIHSKSTSFLRHSI